MLRLIAAPALRRLHPETLVILARRAGTAGTAPALLRALTIARIGRDRETAMTRYRRDRDAAALEATMRQLDRDEAEAQVTQADGPTAAETAEYLRDLPTLWEDAEGSGKRLLAEALFERIEVLDAGRVHLHPSASARAQGWAEAWDGARLAVMVEAKGLAPTLSNCRSGSSAGAKKAYASGGPPRR